VRLTAHSLTLYCSAARLESEKKGQPGPRTLFRTLITGCVEISSF
jgi:hypothetical protein